MEQKRDNRELMYEIREAAEPLIQLLRQKCNMYTKVVVSQTDINVMLDTMGIPLDWDD